MVSQPQQDVNNNPQPTKQNKTIRAKIVHLDALQECGARLRQGDLVAFPTETVYGLGCNALDASAINKVFAAKERPLTDPLITHVTQSQVAFDLWNAEADSLEGKALRVLTDDFWPGPLTLVAKAAPHVPAIIMANTGFVACRSPQHPISIALIDAANVPIAAPSANKFGHVSPTRASHVWDDLLYEDVWIVDAKQNGSSETSSSSMHGLTSVCDVGVESSVAKLEMVGPDEGIITLLRQGAICVGDLQECLKNAGLGSQFTVQAKTKKATNETVAHVAPGQTIRHYSPDIPSYIFSNKNRYNTVSPSDDHLSPLEKKLLAESVLIDFGGKLNGWKDHALAYRELSSSGNSAEATKAVFETLRWAERVENAKQILFPEIVENELGEEQLDALTLALKDRLTRAASGIVIDELK